MSRYFNLTSEEVVYARKKAVFCLVIYDIVSQKRRLKLAKLLESYGVRVQRSCFEAYLDSKTFKRLVSDLSNFYQKEEEDSIIIYKGNQADVIKFPSYQTQSLEESIIFI